MKERMIAIVPRWIWTALQVTGWIVRALLAAVMICGAAAAPYFLWNPVFELDGKPAVWAARLVAIVLILLAAWIFYDLWGVDGPYQPARRVIGEIGRAARARAAAAACVFAGSVAGCGGFFVWIDMLGPAPDGVELNLIGAVVSTVLMVGGPYIVHESLKELEQ